MTARNVSIPGLAWDAIEGSEVLGGGGHVGPVTHEMLDQRVLRSGYCFGLVYALATPRIMRRGRSRSYGLYLADEARLDLLELFEALAIGARDSGTASERQAIATAMKRLS